MREYAHAQSSKWVGSGGMGGASRDSKMDVHTWQAFFMKLSKFFLDYEKYKREASNIDRLTSFSYSAKHYLSTLLEVRHLLIRSISTPDPSCELDDDEAVIVRNVISTLQKLEDDLSSIIAAVSQEEDCLSRRSTTIQTLEFSVEQMCYLRSIGLTWTKISSIFGVSRMTPYLKRKEAGILDDFNFSIISDDDLIAKVKEIKNLMPDIGESMLGGILRSNGICVQRHRIRKALHIVDPIKIALRWHDKVKCRTYSVPGPMSLWHIGNLINLIQ